MRRLFALSAFSLFAVMCPIASARATMPAWDKIRLEGKDTYFPDWPLLSYFVAKSIDLNFDAISTANRVGIEAGWEIRDNKLYLRSFEARRKGKRVKIAELFPGKKLPVLADWYTGTLHIPTGPWKHNSPPLEPEFESVRVVTVEKGVVVRTVEKKNASIRRENGVFTAVESEAIPTSPQPSPPKGRGSKP